MGCHGWMGPMAAGRPRENQTTSPLVAGFHWRGRTRVPDDPWSILLGLPTFASAWAGCWGQVQSISGTTAGRVFPFQSPQHCVLTVRPPTKETSALDSIHVHYTDYTG